MCGFVGFTAVDYDTDTNKAVVKDMADRIAHRGPDDEASSWTTTSPWASAA